MTEVVVENAEQPNNSTTAQMPSAGTLLRQAREAKGMSVQALASALKVPAYKLQALEEDRWEQLTDSVFTRSLASSVCRVLRIPSEPILAGLPKLQGAKLASNPEGINAPFKEKSLRSLMSSQQEASSGKAVKVALALLIAIAGGVGLYFLPQWKSLEDAGLAQAPQTTASTELASSAQPADNATVVTVIPAAPLTNASAPAATAPATEAIAPSASAAGLMEPVLKDVTQTVATDTATAATASSNASDAAAAEPVAPAASAQTAAPPTGSALMRFTATADSWVQVRDAQQRVVMEKVLKAGDVYEATAAGRPFKVVIGNAGATALEIDGAAFDVAASAKNNVARFEVK